jgi:hypothetical protein
MEAAIRSVQVGSATTPGQRTQEQPNSGSAKGGPSTPPNHSVGQLQLTQNISSHTQAFAQRGGINSNQNIAVQLHR